MHAKLMHMIHLVEDHSYSGIWKGLPSSQSVLLTLYTGKFYIQVVSTVISVLSRKRGLFFPNIIGEGGGGGLKKDGA